MVGEVVLERVGDRLGAVEVDSAVIDVRRQPGQVLVHQQHHLEVGADPTDGLTGHRLGLGDRLGEGSGGEVRVGRPPGVEVSGEVLKQSGHRPRPGHLGPVGLHLELPDQAQGGVNLALGRVVVLVDVVGRDHARVPLHSASTLLPT
ncbi:MAG: hypothetical protein ACXWDI_16170 [Nocardioides sp.]